MVNLSELKLRYPIFEIGVEGVVGYADCAGITGPAGMTGLSGEPRYFTEEKSRTKICHICCGKGKVEKQGWFGVIRLVTCKCRR